MSDLQPQVGTLQSGLLVGAYRLTVDGGAFRQVTDFGQRAVLIARQVSWSPDSRFIYGAVIEQDADVVLLEGLVP